MRRLSVQRWSRHPCDSRALARGEEKQQRSLGPHSCGLYHCDLVSICIPPLCL